MVGMFEPTASFHEDRHLLSAGKLSSALLSDLFDLLPTADDQLLLGPAVGEDAAVINLTSDEPSNTSLLVAKSDPITFATREIGHYAVNVCVNDLAVTGATPRFYMPTVLLPAESATETMATTVFQQIGDACRRHQITVAGGHTEVTYTVNQPVVAGTMLGEVQREQIVRSSGCRIHDVVLLAGTVPVEGISIIAREKRAELLAAGWSESDLDEAAGYLHVPGISVKVPALAAAKQGLVSAMHDPTEGGIMTGLAELATASGIGVAVDLDAIPISPLAHRLCHRYNLDPLGTIASGALLATCSSDDVDRLTILWRDLGWPVVVIGQITPSTEGLTAHHAGQATTFPTFATDEITKLFS